MPTKRNTATVLEENFDHNLESWEIQWDGCFDTIDMGGPDAVPMSELAELEVVGEDSEGQPLRDESVAILARLEKFFGTGHGFNLGAASWRELHDRCERALRWAQHKHDPARGSFENFARAIVATKMTQFRREYPRLGLYRESRDEELRHLALANDAHLTTYLRATQKLIQQAQHAYPRRWHVPNMRDEDVVGDLLVRVLEHLRSGESWTPYERIARAATFIFCDRQRRALKKRRQIFEVTATGYTRDDLVSFAPSPEDLAGGRELSRVYDAASKAMSKTQRTWLAAMRADVVWYGDLNEARVAKQLGKSRSAASLAKRSLRDALERTLGSDGKKR